MSLKLNSKHGFLDISRQTKKHRYIPIEEVGGFKNIYSE